VLYPNDESEQGKRLRLSQQYFFVSCSIQDILRMHEMRGLAMEDLADSVALQLNDTHPAIGVAELMRILIDEKQLSWDSAWRNHEKYISVTPTIRYCLKPSRNGRLKLFGLLLPRHLEIIYEINSRFLAEIKTQTSRKTTG
jgi:starch phosphorylase